MHIVTLGTGQKGGIDSVIQGYIQDGLFNGKKHTRVITHLGEHKWQDLTLFLFALIKVCYLSISCKNLILHCHMSYKGSFFRKLCFTYIGQLFNHKVIVHLHGSEFKDYFSKSGKLRKRLIIKLIKKVDEFVVLSDSWKEFIQEISGRESLVINNYVDITKLDVVRASKQVLFLGAFIQRKGVYDLLRAFKALGSEYHLHLCGSGENEQVEQLITELDISHMITNHGWIDTRQKAQLLSECSAFILPTYNEGLPMVIIEAMACEIPIITTPVGGIPEVIKEGITGHLITPGEIAEITQSLINVHKNDCSQSIEQAKNYYNKHFSSKVILPKWECLYRNLEKSNSLKNYE